MVKLEQKQIQVERGDWRAIEKLLSRKEFFQQIDDMGLISIILKSFSKIPVSIRELAVEEAFEKAEIQLLHIFDEWLP